MALVTCPECKKEISDKASSCPNCGFPLEKSEIILNDNEIGEDKRVTEKEKSNDDGNTDNEETPKKNFNLKKWGIGLGIVLVTGLIAFFATANSRKYSQATRNYENGLYEDALTIYKDLGDYKDSVNMYKVIAYEYAQALYIEENYEASRGYFEEAGDYEDSIEMVEKCTYNLTVDGQFMLALSKGLMARWEYNDSGYLEEFDTKIEQMDASDYVEFMKKCVALELDLVSEFESDQFTDNALGAKAKEYIELLNDSLKTIDYYNMDFQTYSVKWDKIYANRMLMIRDFVNDYNLTVDDSYQKTLNEFLTNASVVDEQIALEESVEEILRNAKLSSKTDEWGYKEYFLHVKNTSDVTFEYFSIDINVLDSNGNIIDSGSASGINSWKPNQEAKMDVYFYEEDSNPEEHELELNAWYNIEM